MTAFNIFCAGGAIRIIPDKRRPHFGNRNSILKTHNRRQVLVSNNIPQGITDVCQNGFKHG